MINKSNHVIFRWSIWIVIYSYSTKLIVSLPAATSTDGPAFLSSSSSSSSISTKDSFMDRIGNFSKSDNNESFPVPEIMKNISMSENSNSPSDSSSFQHGSGGIQLRAMSGDLKVWGTMNNNTNLSIISENDNDNDNDNDRNKSIVDTINPIQENNEVLDNMTMAMTQIDDDRNISIADDMEGNKKRKKKRIKKRKKTLNNDIIDSTVFSNDVTLETESKGSKNDKIDNIGLDMNNMNNIKHESIFANAVNKSDTIASMNTDTDTQQYDSKNVTNENTNEKDIRNVEIDEVHNISVNTNTSHLNETGEPIELHNEQSKMNNKQYQDQKQNKEIKSIRTKKSKKSSQRKPGKQTKMEVHNKESTTRKKKITKRKRKATKINTNENMKMVDSDDEDFQDFINVNDVQQEKKDTSIEDNDFDLTLNALIDDHSDEETEGTNIKNEDNYDDNNQASSTTTYNQKTNSNFGNNIKVCLITWNLAEAACDPSDASFIRHLVTDPQNDGKNIKQPSPDIVLIGGQECENTKPRRSEGHRSRQFRSLAIKNLGRDYIPLAIHSLGGVQCLLFCHRRIHPHIDLVNVADVACGVGNVFHNKGAIGVFLQLTPKGSRTPVKFLFVTAHLAAHVKNVQARNDDFWRIISEFEGKSPPRFLPPKDTFAISDRRAIDLSSGANIPMDGDLEKTDGGKHLLDSMDHIFFCGDLNYRVDLPREIVEHSLYKIKEIKTNNKKQRSEAYRKLIMHDQLTSTIARRDAFPDFSEGQIQFAPTFKFNKGTNVYDTSYKQRIPAWTDRILFKQKFFNDETKKGFGVKVLQYDSVDDAMHSDHRPVFGVFQVGMGHKTN